jgi:H/ACA ribonucleoprotein complex subunit 4
MPETDKKKKKSKEAKSAKKAAKSSSSDGADYTIQPSSETPKLDTSNWPLLLKNYDTLNIRTAHYTPIPNGCSPLKRPLKDYVKYVAVAIHFIYSFTYIFFFAGLA